MAITKQYLKSKPICKVTFSVSAADASKITVLGTFNEWNAERALELKKLKNGTFRGTLNLEKDNSYEFRYLVDGTFINDEHADAYKTNEFGGENAVLNL
ncbi:isoamylase early set domain-containing protein [Gelidibacter salicanalis]|uniref:Isoamylase early set domain-containing protein n=1 Tax=Gelidibacter salicanalis TaxID=291193 RepID=A0A934KUA8_9FLAO|nr:isoamylase early set domain-containing protein [Gelidibacter salicanalis]MBJ7880328.1 isoamylase early set domain-containing protein [Gelidibacter salicanalis]